MTMLRGWTASLETTDLEVSKNFQGFIYCPAARPNEANSAKLDCNNSWLIKLCVNSTCGSFTCHFLKAKLCKQT